MTSEVEERPKLVTAGYGDTGVNGLIACKKRQMSHHAGQEIAAEKRKCHTPGSSEDAPDEF